MSGDKKTPKIVTHSQRLERQSWVAALGPKTIQTSAHLWNSLIEHYQWMWKSSIENTFIIQSNILSPPLVQTMTKKWHTYLKTTNNKLKKNSPKPEIYICTRCIESVVNQVDWGFRPIWWTYVRERKTLQLF